MKKSSLWFLAAAMAILAGCTSDTSEGDDPSAPESEPAPVSTSRSSVEPKTTCIPQKIPVCGTSETLTCYGTGICRRCGCAL
jgi:hypothetical protein